MTAAYSLFMIVILAIFIYYVFLALVIMKQMHVPPVRYNERIRLEYDIWPFGYWYRILTDK